MKSDKNIVISKEEMKIVNTNIKIGIYRELHLKSLLSGNQLLELIEKGGEYFNG